ncbi:carbohydrate sulfotransferase 10-like isoform X2 [Branchiostoma lanceolatum]|uniref:carbohydrate sulfotransferase 10-like isoform X2 n=1 Tax=Branchiostoma lanceolatum TaxID=7740 RepID=UPI0034551991
MKVSVIFHWLVVAVLLGTILLLCMYISLGNTEGNVAVTLVNSTRLSRDVPDNRSLAEKRQSVRMALIKEYCRKNDRRNITFPPLRRFVVDERHKLLYCQVFKTGSTTTLTILHNLEHGKKRSTRGMRKTLDTHPFKRLNNYTKEGVRLRFEKYTKLMIVRDPLERLVSAWKDKFVVAPARFGYWKTYQSMLEALSSDTLRQQTENGTIQQVPFLAFIKAVGTNRRDWQDLHWQLISNLCTPCQIDYDFIAHTETLAEDFPLFFKKAGIVGRNDLLPKTQSREGDRLLWDFYRQVHLEDLHRIKLKFKADYDMFGYSFDEDMTEMLNHRS